MPKPCSLLQQEPWRALCWGHVWGWHILLAVDTSVFFLSCSTARSELALTGSVSAEWCLARHRAREHHQTLLREACGSRRDLGIIPPLPLLFPPLTAKPCSPGEQEEGGGAPGRPSYLHLGTSMKQAWLPTKHGARAAPTSAVPEHGSKSSAAGSRFWSPWQEMMPSPSSPVFRPLWPVQAPAHTLAGTRWIFALPAAEYCQKQSCFQGLRMEKGRHRQEKPRPRLFSLLTKSQCQATKEGCGRAPSLTWLAKLLWIITMGRWKLALRELRENPPGKLTF